MVSQWAVLFHFLVYSLSVKHHVRETLLLLPFGLLVLNCSPPLSTLPSIMSTVLYSPDFWSWSSLLHFWPCPFPEALWFPLSLWPWPWTHKPWFLSFLQPGCFSLFKADTSFIQFLHLLSLLPSQTYYVGIALIELTQPSVHNLDSKNTFWKRSLW